MCVDLPTSTGLSRRGMLGLAAAGLGAAAVVPATAELANADARAQAPLSAIPPALMDHRHTAQVVLLGVAGGPPPEINRAGIGNALVIGDRVYVVDCGRGAVTQFAQSRLPFKNIKGIFITHLHADHVIDLYDYLALPGFGVNDSDDGILAPTAGQAKVQIYGPGPADAMPPAPDGVPTIAPDASMPGLKAMIDLQMQAFAYSTNLFMRTAGIPDPRSLFDVHEIANPANASFANRAPAMEPFVIHDDGFVKVSAILVPHGPCFPSYAFRFDSEEGSVVFSGDTAYSENVIKLAKDADTLIHEVIDVNFYANFLGIDPALLGHLTRSHTDVNQLGGLAEKAGAKRLVLTHLVPADPKLMSDSTWRKNARKGYSGQVIVGSDLLRIPLPTRAKVIS